MRLALILAAALAASPAVAQRLDIQDTGKGADRPTTADLAYESRIRASVASAQSFQGPLDGGWTLAAADGGALYVLQLSDRGTGVVEGAWRDPRRPGAIAATGLIDQVEAAGGTVTLRFGDGSRVAVLRAGADGGWVGELSEPEGQRPVVLKKRDR